MVFRDQAQKIAACRVLCEREGIIGAWTDAGPVHAEEMLCSTALSSDQKIVLQAAVAHWTGKGGFADHGLSAAPRHTLMSFRAAIADGPAAIDEWLAAG